MLMTLDVGVKSIESSDPENMFIVVGIASLPSPEPWNVEIYTSGFSATIFFPVSGDVSGCRNDYY
jgi:hypothetical protein